MPVKNVKNIFKFVELALVYLACVQAAFAQNSASSNHGTNIALKLDDTFDRETLAMINGWDRSAETNGFILAMERDSDLKRSLTRHINIINVTTNLTNLTMGYLLLPFEGCTEIELVNSKGKLVEKTDWGKSFGLWSVKQIDKWLAAPLKWHSVRFFPASYFYVGPLDLRDCFKIQKSLVSVGI